MGPYDDIINLPHHVSTRHPQMPIRDRAAQFSPFAALTGYEGEVAEAARITETKIELTEEQRAILDERLCLLEDILPDRPDVEFTYFIPDHRKQGGAYTTITGKLKRLDRIERNILLTNGASIPIDDLLEMDCRIWSDSRDQLNLSNTLLYT